MGMVRALSFNAILLAYGISQRADEMLYSITARWNARDASISNTFPCLNPRVNLHRELHGRQLKLAHGNTQSAIHPHHPQINHTNVSSFNVPLHTLLIAFKGLERAACDIVGQIGKTLHHARVEVEGGDDLKVGDLVCDAEFLFVGDQLYVAVGKRRKGRVSDCEAAGNASAMLLHHEAGY